MRFNFNKSMVALKGENLHLKHIKMPLNTFSKSPKLFFYDRIMFQKKEVQIKH